MNGPELLQAQATGAQPPHNTDQLSLYDSLVQAVPGMTLEHLDRYYKDASFGVKPDDVEREYSPQAGVTVLRDEGFGVPHVYGDTRADVMFGAGYVSAEDRLFMMDVLRHVGRGRLSEFLGASPSNLASDYAQYRVADYTEAELQGMIDRLDDLDRELGSLFQGDMLDYSAGVNAYINEALADPRKLPAEYLALQQAPLPWRSTDVVAVASLIGGRLGVGGGGELRNARFLKALRDEGHSAEEARAIFDDFRFANDPEAPVTTDTEFPWLEDLGPVDPASVAMPDDPAAVLTAMSAAGAPATIDGPFGPIRLAFPDAASNALLVGADLSETGRPIAVMGPQVAYWSPEILSEVDLHGPGIHARGAGFPGISLYVLLGRGAGYAWSATSAGGDLVDTWAVELCDPDGPVVSQDSTHYLRDGQCVPMYRRTDSWVAKPSAGGVPGSPAKESILVEVTTERTDKGIVQARGTVGGKPVAFVLQRSSYGAEVDSGLAYVEMLDPERIDGAEDFQRAFGRFSFTFNWFYLDDEDIAFELGGYHPLRAAGVDPDLPVWDRDRWDWRGMLAFEDTPKTISPEKGFITSWNNKQAPGFRAADNEWSYGPVHRSQPLDDRIHAAARADGKLNLAELVDAMGDAATVDLRGDKVLPFMLEAVGSPADPRVARAADLLAAWHRSGAHRRDRDADGAYEDAAAVALMDEWWGRALSAVFRPALGKAFGLVPQGQDDEPGPVGSAYIGGWYGQLQKDLRGVLGLPVRGAFSRGYCGGGDLAACRAALTASLDDAVKALEALFGADPAGWRADQEGDRIRYSALGVQGQASMQWQNRPTFQQVLEFDEHDRGDDGREAACRTAARPCRAHRR